MTTIRVIVSGVGGVGSNMVRISQMRPGIEVVGAYSRNPALAGRDLGEIAGGTATGFRVTGKAEALEVDADVLLIATTSFLKEVESDIHEGIQAGLNVMCTAEEMASPFDIDPDIVRAIDQHAREAGVTVLGAGANPGYIYEVVGLALTGAVWRVDQIRVRRVVDLSGFSAGVLGRLGIGFDESSFQKRVEAHQIYGHIGFPHTMRSFARRFGVDLESVSESIKPTLADEPISSAAVSVGAGESAGFIQQTSGFVDGRPWFTAEFVGHIDLSSVGLSPRDSYEIDGLPNIRGVVEPGFNPQFTTIGALANFLPHLVDATPGLISVTDLPIPSPWI